MPKGKLRAKWDKPVDNWHRRMTIFQPHTPAHAIEQAVVGVRLLHDADEACFTAAVKMASELQDKFDLPGRMQVDPMSLMFGRQALTMGYRSGSMEMKPGVVFQRVNPDGSMVKELSIEPSGVTLRTQEYDRWSTMQNLINGLLAPVAKALCASQIGRVTAIELRCVDRFIAPAGERPALSEAISAASPLAPNYLIEKTSFLHSHTGWFEDEGEQGRVLVNVNIDVGEDGDCRTLNILQVVSRQSSGINTEYYGSLSFEDSLLNALEANHRRDKALLGGILVPALANAIGLNGSSGVDVL